MGAIRVSAYASGSIGVLGRLKIRNDQIINVKVMNNEPFPRYIQGHPLHITSACEVHASAKGMEHIFFHGCRDKTSYRYESDPVYQAIIEGRIDLG